MNPITRSAIAALFSLPLLTIAQETPPAPGGPPPDRPFGRPPSGGPGGPGGPMGEERKVLAQFDKDGNKRLDATERAAAREFLKKNPSGGGRGFGPRPGGPGETSEPKPGAHISPADVKPETVADLYAPNVLRTIFIDFENNDWESELADFHKTDVEVPATLTVDGKKYPGAGVHFRGMSSYMMVRPGQKRSLNVELDYTDKKQNLGGYRTLNLLNSHEDDSFLDTVLYSQISRTYIPAPKANFVRVVINGENWGVYVNAQQFNKEFVRENFKVEKGARWKASGSPWASGGLDYIGEDIAEYKKHYDMKSGKDEDWRALIKLCRTMSETPPEKLEAALAPMLDIEGALWFIALDNALINGDGYWIRQSDYAIYRDPSGKFHILPHDMNEAFSPPHGPGMGGPGGGAGRPGGPGGPQGAPGAQPGGPQAGGPGGQPGGPDGGQRPPGQGRGPGGGGGGLQVKGVELDPLIGLDDAKKPLRSRLLAVPALRSRYLADVRTIAKDSLDWSRLGPVVAKYRALIEKELEADTRKLSSFDGFQKATSDAPAKEAAPVAEGAPRRGPEPMSLRAFAEQRRAYLLNYPAIKSLAP